MLSYRVVGSTALALSLVLFASSPALAKKNRYDSWATYTIPFTCGPNDSGDGSAAPGIYATAITVTNANLADKMARARVQLTDPASAPTERIHRNLPAGHSLLIDCDTLLDGAFIMPVTLDVNSFYQGVLTVDSRAWLNVVVQTSATSLDGADISVENRQVEGMVVKHRRNSYDDDKAEICHIPPGNPDKRHTIEVGRASVSAHLGHGDHHGECDGDEVEHHDEDEDNETD